MESSRQKPTILQQKNDSDQKFVQLRVDMVSAQFLCYKLQKMERTRKSTIRIFILSLFFGAGVEPCKIRPCHPFLFIANDKRCLRHVPIKVVMNFAAPGNQFLPKQIVGIAEPVYLRGTQIHIYLSIYLI